MPDVRENRATPPEKQANGRSSPQSVVGPEPSPHTATRPSHGASPFAFMRRFLEDMDRLFEDFGVAHGRATPRLVSRGRELMRREAGLIPADWSPRVDVLEREGSLVVRADLPGLSKDDIKVEIEDDLLTIEGVRKEEKQEGREGRYYGECSYGRFYRAIPLLEGADAEKATAEFRDGVLEVSIPAPRRTEPQSRRVEVQEKK
jgi:HSP20 family protein